MQPYLGLFNPISSMNPGNLFQENWSVLPRFPVFRHVAASFLCDTVVFPSLAVGVLKFTAALQSFSVAGEHCSVTTDPVAGEHCSVTSLQEGLADCVDIFKKLFYFIVFFLLLLIFLFVF